MYSRLISLIGKSRDYPDFENLCLGLGPPSVSAIGKHLTLIDYPEAGLGFEFEPNMVAVHFDFDTVSTRSGESKQYTGDLPSGICARDQRLAVRHKLGTEPVRSQRVQTNDPEGPEDYWEYYNSNGLTLNFSFNGLDERLVGLSVRPIYI
jgi:hypothetical protein